MVSASMTEELMDMVVYKKKGMQSLNDVGARRRRNFSIKRKVVLSPAKDDVGDYLDSMKSAAPSEKEDQRRLKRMFFETYLEAGKAEGGLDTSGALPAMKTIFDRDDSPTEAIE